MSESWWWREAKGDTADRTSQTIASTGGLRAQLKHEIAGLSYDEQVERLRPTNSSNDRAGAVVQRTADEGSAMVVGSAANTEVAFVNTFTPRLVARLLRDDEPMTLDEALVDVTGLRFTQDTENHDRQNPTLFQYGQQFSEVDPARSRTKLAVLVPNENYASHPDGWRNPAGVAEETKSLGDALEGTGYMTMSFPDQTQAGMEAQWSVLSNALLPGDYGVAYFAGHGTTEGLAGVNDRHEGQTDIFSNSQIAAVVNAATDRGVHIRFIIDACRSGSAVDAVREERVGEVARNAETQYERLAALAAGYCHTMKNRLIEMVEERNNLLIFLTNAIGQHESQRPPDDSPQFEAWATIWLYLSRTKRQAECRHDRNIEAYWDSIVRGSLDLRRLIRESTGQSISQAPPITDRRTYGAQIDWLDELANATMALDEPSGL